MDDIPDVSISAISSPEKLRQSLPHEGNVPSVLAGHVKNYVGAFSAHAPKGKSIAERVRRLHSSPACAELRQAQAKAYSTEETQS